MSTTRTGGAEGCCVVCSDAVPAEKGAWPECASGHWFCPDCFSSYVVHTWSVRDFGVGVVPELTCCAERCRQAFTAQAVAKYASPEAWTTYEEIRSRARESLAIAEVQQRLSSQGLSAASASIARAPNAQDLSARRKTEEEARERILLGEQLRRQVKNARMCPRCRFGPIEHAFCGDLAAHHGQVRNGAKISNACPKCSFFAPREDAWPTWDGIMRPINHASPTRGGPLAIIMLVTNCGEAEATYAYDKAIIQVGADDDRVLDIATEIALERVSQTGPAYQPTPKTLSWRFEQTDADLICLLQNLRLRVWRYSLGWIEVTHGTHVRKNVYNEVYIIPPYDRIPPSTGRVTFPPKFGNWILTQEGLTIEIRNRLRPDNVLWLNADGYRAESGVQAAVSASVPRTTTTTAWRFRMTESGLECHRRRLCVTLPFTSNGFIYLRANDKPRIVVTSSDNPVVTIARAHSAPLGTKSVSDQFAHTVGNWRLSEIEGCVVAQCTVGGRMILLGRAGFEALKETELPRNTEDALPLVIELGKKFDLVQDDPKDILWRFSHVSSDLVCSRRGLVVALPSKSNGWFRLIRSSGEAEIIHSTETAELRIVSENMLPVDDDELSTEVPMMFGFWEIQRHGMAIFARCTNNSGRVVVFKRGSLKYLKQIDCPTSWSDIRALDSDAFCPSGTLGDFNSNTTFSA